ncbi:YlbF family regulator [Paenibacillus sp. ACRRX]|uniref:YlbF family regulator n=1 Tax=unclassified Paenibacillus TaxID=185978 RepID=UPI001EF5C294|nr:MULTISPECIES: YlbF family regulator [unclassified Paenibacillus]MCG7407618.1 YlbF family regulator [Paenibacillus sp. ACRRX]MDK8180853.1 YlbF family regulator [Paenibacillus sp. UMB4589-SE434]
MPQEHEPVDMAALLIQAYELGDMIKDSAEMASYLYWKERMATQQDVQQLVLEFARKKETFSETERFGHYHPDYHEAKAAVKAVERQLHEYEEVRQYKQAEEQLDEMLYELSKTIATAVSDTIKVPSNSLKSTGGCGSGCSGSCGSC